MKIVVLDGFTANPGDLSWAALEELGDVTVYERTAAADVIARLKGAQIALTNKVPIDAAVMDACPDLTYIGLLATGYNIVDTAYAKTRGIVVTNVPAYSTMAVAQLTIALLLEICHHAGAHARLIQEGKWSSRPDFTFWDYPLVELDGKTMGIIGFGQIGRATARIARALGMRVIVYSRTRDVSRLDEGMRYVELDELYAAADVVSLHCPLYEDTRQMIDRRSIAQMKDGVILLNTARGGLTNEADVADALSSGKISWAGIDVFSVEPPPADHPLITHAKCIATPHFGWAPIQARTRLLAVAAENVRYFLEGTAHNVVNL
ncbi:MAG: D-2-hydroxyacid dehydrogenase [Eubacteriales bacterium]|nr:D-2-hydroxyacid dehydrogenase [Eubacteriales bacterium]